MVRDYHVRTEGPCARLRDETLPRVAARTPRTVLAGTRQPRTQHLRAEVVQIAVLRAMQPFNQAGELRLLRVVEREPPSLHDFLKRTEAEVVRTSLQHSGAEVPRVFAQHLRGAGKVLRD